MRNKQNVDKTSRMVYGKAADYQAYITEAISERALKQADIARVLGLTVAAVSAKMRGKRAWTLVDLQQINDALLPGSEIILPPHFSPPVVAAEVGPVVLPARSRPVPRDSTPPGGYLDSLNRARLPRSKSAEWKALVLAELRSGKDRKEVEAAIAEQYKISEKTVSNEISKRIKDGTIRVADRRATQGDRLPGELGVMCPVEDSGVHYGTLYPDTSMQLALA